MPPKHTVAMDAEAIERAITRIAREIAEHNQGAGQIALVGIVRRGATLARRIAATLARDGATTPAVGTLDIASYRDDHKSVPGDPRLLGREIAFALDRKQVVLIDDVLYTGRTVRAGLTALTDLGRPASIQLAVLVDRGAHQVPIRADYIGKNISAPTGQRVYVRFTEVDGVDSVVIGEPKP